MEKTQVRLELVKLCYSPHQEMVETVAKAEKLEEYIFRCAPPEVKVEPAQPAPAVTAPPAEVSTGKGKDKAGKGKVGNPNPLE